MPSQRTALSMISVALLAGLPFACRTAPAQQQPAQQQPAQQQTTPAQPITTLHATTRIVALDVIVNDGKGHPVTGLKQSDFTLYEDGVPQTLLSFTERDATMGAHTSAQPALPSNTFAVAPTYSGDGSSTVVVFGQMDPTDAPWARKQLKNYLTQTQPGTPMAIIRQDNQGTHLVQALTGDRQLLLTTVNERLLPARPLVHTYGLRSGFNLAHYLSSIPGHINLIWFGSGINPSNPFPDITSFVQDPNGLKSVLQLSRIAIYPMDVSAFVGFYGSGIGNTFGAYSGPTLINPGSGPIGDVATQTGGRAFRSTNSYVPAITEVVNTGAHYYTISYTPTNPVWNGAYRSIRLDVPSYSITPQNALTQALGIPEKNEFKLEYRRGYFATNLPATAPPSPTTTASQPTPPPAPAAPQPAPQRRLLSSSRLPRPVKPAPTPMAAAMAFGTPTPTALRFTVSITPLPEIDRSGPLARLGADTFLTPPFQAMNYRNYQIHYRIAPQDLKLVKSADGSDIDDLQFVSIVYRDDGVEANSLASPGHIAFPSASYGPIMASPFGFDQEIAVPVSGAFYLRAGVHEMASGRIGAIELPVNEIKLTPPDPQPLSAASNFPSSQQ